jgi:hypothetical protein
LAPEESERINQFLCFAIIFWRNYALRVEQDGGDTDITNLTLRLLDPSGSRFQGFFELTGEHSREAGSDELLLPDWEICLVLNVVQYRGTFAI